MLPRIENTTVQPGQDSPGRPADYYRSSSLAIPLPEIRFQERNAEEYVTVTPIDKGGRLADRSPLSALGWHPGYRVRITAHPNKGVIVVVPDGPHRLMAAGHLRLPSDIRHACHLENGDRLLVIAYPRQSLLIMATAHSTMLMIKSWLRPSDAPLQP